MKIIVLAAIIIIGTIGYLEKILKFQLPRRYIIFLFILFLLFSMAQLKLSADSDQEINLLKTTIEKSDAELSKLRENTAAQDKKIISLETDLVESNKSLSEVKKKTAPRKITPEQRAKLTAALKTIASPMPIYFGILAGDTEAEDYSKELRVLFAECGHPVPKENIVNLIIMPQPRGLWISLASVNDPASSVARQLQDAFELAGLKLHGRIDEAETPGRIRLVVGAKP